GTLNDFLGAMTEDDARPEALRRFELMVEEVARNASVVAQNTAAAKKSASDASTSASEAATRATDAAGSARAASTSAGQAESSAQSASSSAGTASTKASEASKSAAAAESSKSAAATSAAAAKTSETNAAASQQSAATSASAATTKASEAATSARDAAASKEAAKSSETNASSSASSAASSATAAGNSAKAAKTSETNARSSETAAGQSASAAAGSKTAAASSASAASTSAGQASASATAAGKSAESAASSASTATTKAGEATEQASAAARSASAAKTSETNAKASETRAESSKTAAASSASSAASSASSASASKDEATRQASAAKGSATTASTKATEAAGSATAASQSKTAAESAATRAEAAADRAEEIAGAVAMEDASLTTKGVVKLSSAVDSTSESLAATPKAVKVVNDNANSRLAKNQNGADIPDKGRFLSNINVYSKGEVDKKKGMRKYTFSAPANAVSGKWYPVVFRRTGGGTDELASRVVITTYSSAGGYAMNNCEFNGFVMPGGWSDRGSYAAGFFSIYSTAERAIHSIIASVKDDDLCSVFYVETRAFPIQIFAEEGLNVIVPTADYAVGQTTYKWGATDPLSESTNAQIILDFKNGRGYYCSHPFISSLSGNAATATKLQTARSIGGVVFDGSANINLPGVNTTGNQNTTGNAATATKLQTVRKISGVPFDGSTDITLTAAHVAAFARRATGSYADADGGVPWNAESGAYNVTRTGDSYILANFYTGVGSCRTLQIKAHYKNGGLFYRSSRDGSGFESGWEQVYTTGFRPQPADINAPTAAAGWLNSGNGTAFTTAQFITWLNNQGAFSNKYWIARCSWTYANNNYIDDTGCGRIDLSGSVIEVFSNKSTSHYTIRVTTTTTSGHGGVNNAEFIYVYNGSDYAPGWRRSYNTRNKPTASDVGALSLSGGALTGGLTAAGEIISKSANGLRIAYGNYGFFIRNDGSNTYFMLTDSGNSLGTYNSLRPFIISNSTGNVTIATKLNASSGITGSLSGNASTATKLQTARTIGGVSFDGTANINLPGVNAAGNQNTTGNAATATKLQTARNINGVKFDGSGDININTLVSRGRVTALSGSTQGTAGIQMYEAYNNSYPTTYGNVLHMKGASAAGEGELLIGWSGTDGAHAPVYVRSRRDTSTANWSGWAQVYTSRDSIPGVNATGNQNTTGNAATATKLQTARTINGVSFDGSKNIELTPRSIGTINSATMSFSGGAGWFKLATVTMPQASSVVYISLIGGAGFNVGAPQQAGISELVLRAGNGNPKGITGALWRRTSVGFTNFAWVNTSGDTYDIYVEIGNYATGVNIQWDYTSNASVTIHTSPTYTANKPTGLTDGTVYVIYSSHIKPTAAEVGALSLSGGQLNGALGIGTSSALGGNSIVLGDNDTGFKQNGDGILDVYANSAHVFRFVNSTLQSLKPLSVTGDITSSAWVYANRFSINSGSGAWIDMRNQNVIFGRNAVSTSSAQALLRQDHADRKFFLGGLGNSQFGFYMINNSRTENGTDANAYLQNDGTWVCGGNGSFNDVYIRSDRRSKRNIRKIERALDKLDRIEGVLYEIQVCDRYEQSGGLIAQDVQNVQPELVTVDHNDQSGEPRLRLNYNGVIGMLVEAVKELREEVRELKAKM
ncbi:TPA: prophage tail fiber N-terminal domain-containing protein, partial [Escherichia coli]|nr:prophage tail fiber N-terminal domain-containing protein [Escherichia coli]